jgi:hypothetical protein
MGSTSVSWAATRLRTALDPSYVRIEERKLEAGDVN